MLRRSTGNSASKNHIRHAEGHGFVLGSGLVALDVVLGSKHTIVAVGGTCGNVLLVLRFLGWRASPVSRLANDTSARLILQEMDAWGVDTTYVTRNTGGKTPVIVQTIKKNKAGVPTPRFSWYCPLCGSRFPSFCPILTTFAEEMVSEIPAPQVFFFDRVSRGILRLAERSSQLGAVVVFEPTSIGDVKLFKEAWSLAHIVKYSTDRIRELPELASTGQDPILHVETLGAGGLRYRHRIASSKFGNWQSLEAPRLLTVVDSSGAGDWCTAGILEYLCRRGINGLRSASGKAVSSALTFAQALAGWSCMFEGARGGMIACTLDQCLGAVKEILHRKPHSAHECIVGQADGRKVRASICPACNQPYEVFQA